MPLSRLNVRTLRNLQEVSIRPGTGLNILYGLNASGKTSILEAIYILGHGRSFRTNKIQTAIQNNQKEFSVFAELQPDQIKIGVQKTTDERIHSRINGVDIHNSSSLATNLPLILITPESFKLVNEGPEFRRHYIDWLMFHVEHDFHRIWLTYAKTLKQRNALLKQRRSKQELLVWTQQLAEIGTKLHRIRQTHIEPIIQKVRFFLNQLELRQELNFTYRSGWNREINLEQALTNNLDSDYQLGYTTVGPHRAEIAITVEQKKAMDILSRGQQKILVSALKLAQLSLYKTMTGKTPIILIDDIAAELDSEHRYKLLKTLRDMDIQAFVTAIDYTVLDLSIWPEHKVFHVEHGLVKEVV